MYKKGLFICLVMLGLNGCVSTEKKETPEEKAYAEKVAKLYWDRVKANAARMEARDKAAAIKAKDERKIAKARLIENEAEILKKKQKIASMAQSAKFNVTSSGLTINGNSIIDAEGEITNAGYNDISGEYTYIVQSDDNN